MIRVVIADDHAIVRGGLRMLLDSEPDVEVVAEAETAEHYLPNGSRSTDFPVIGSTVSRTRTLLDVSRREPA